jgi:pimeloyl-ACP methyl ester carboxylesterase
MLTRPLIAALLLVAPSLLTAQAAPSRVGNGAAEDLAHPASMDEIGIPSGGVRLNGLIYLAAGAGPHPVAVFLHGYPGNERNLDLAQAVRRAGYDAVYFDYRGSWGTGGTFSFQNSLDDVAAALAWVRAPENVVKYHLDPSRIALVGHSLGGWLALTSGGREPANVCVAALAAWNIGWLGKRFADHPDERAENLAYFRATTDPSSGPIRAKADDLIREMADHAGAWDYLSKASALRDRALFLAAATRDTPDEGVALHDRLARAVAAAGGRRVRVVRYEDDHGFSTHREELSDALVQWLRTDCAAGQL